MKLDVHPVGVEDLVIVVEIKAGVIVKALPGNLGQNLLQLEVMQGAEAVAQRASETPDGVDGRKVEVMVVRLGGMEVEAGAAGWKDRGLVHHRLVGAAILAEGEAAEDGLRVLSFMYQSVKGVIGVLRNRINLLKVGLVGEQSLQVHMLAPMALHHLLQALIR
jgi:hypothetical protein